VARGAVSGTWRECASANAVAPLLQPDLPHESHDHHSSTTSKGTNCFINGSRLHAKCTTAAHKTAACYNALLAAMSRHAQCHNCGKKFIHFRCGGCFAVGFCSAACQRANWPAHRRYCAVMATVLGRMASGRMTAVLFESALRDVWDRHHPRLRQMLRCVLLLRVVPGEVAAFGAKGRAVERPQSPGLQPESRASASSLCSVRIIRSTETAARHAGRLRAPLQRLLMLGHWSLLRS